MQNVCIQSGECVIAALHKTTFDKMLLLFHSRLRKQILLPGYSILELINHT